MPDRTSILYLEPNMLDRLCGKEESYQAKNPLIHECKNNATVSWTVVSDVLTLFPHLTLDENYELICYIYRHYHGINGQVVAVAKNASFIPDIKSVGVLKGFWGPDYSLPESSVPPMEAIYTDGTPEGYLEAIMAAETIPNMIFNDLLCTRSHSFIAEPPADLEQNWIIYTDLKDWRPRIVHNHTEDIWTLSIVCKETTILGEDTIKPSISEELFLQQYTFKKTLYLSYLLNENKGFHSVANNHLFNNSRYTEHRRCTIPKEQFILLASKTSPYTL